MVMGKTNLPNFSGHIVLCLVHLKSKAFCHLVAAISQQKPGAGRLKTESSSSNSRGGVAVKQEGPRYRLDSRKYRYQCLAVGSDRRNESKGSVIRYWYLTFF
jgi:hypothetical protein